MVATKLNYEPQFLCFISLVSFGATAPSEPELPYSQRRTTVGRTSLTTHCTHNTHTHPCSWLYSNPQSQQARVHRPTP